MLVNNSSSNLSPPSLLVSTLFFLPLSTPVLTLHVSHCLYFYFYSTSSPSQHLVSSPPLCITSLTSTLSPTPLPSSLLLSTSLLCFLLLSSLHPSSSPLLSYSLLPPSQPLSSFLLLSSPLFSPPLFLSLHTLSDSSSVGMAGLCVQRELADAIFGYVQCAFVQYGTVQCIVL